MELGLLSIPYVSHGKRALPYASGVREKDKTPLKWGTRFREALKARNSNLAKLAEHKKVDRSESALRSWTNGTRDINLSEFLQLCDAAGIDPAVVLFAGKVDNKFLDIGEAWGKANPVQREVLWTAAQGILAQNESLKRGTGTS